MGQPGGVDGDPHVHTLAARIFLNKKKHTLRIQDEHPEVSWRMAIGFPEKNHSDGKGERILRGHWDFLEPKPDRLMSKLGFASWPSDSLEGLAIAMCF